MYRNTCLDYKILRDEATKLTPCACKQKTDKSIFTGKLFSIALKKKTESDLGSNAGHYSTKALT